ncbi:MAG: phosphoribosyltransferase [Acidimicrobiia bacterium]|jgi:predicted phosphoribosyltransferase|nr:phosphoribosyltransferase [Acidimicrobiia bacterium]
MSLYRDRAAAGRELAGHLAHRRGTHPLVLGLAGGGVVVAAEVAAALEGPLEVIVAVPFGPPGIPELSIGAATADGGAVVEEGLAERLGLSEADLAPVVAEAVARARRRERALRRSRGLEVGGRNVLVVDDGVAGGAPLRAVLGRVRRAGPAHLTCALPVGPAATIDLIAAEADEVVCPLQPLRFRAVADWYEEYGEVPDEAVAALLAARVH